MQHPDQLYASGPLIREGEDGYETGGLLYFIAEGQEMVAVIRSRKEFDRHRRTGATLQSYADSAVSSAVYRAVRDLETLIPKQS